MADSRDDLRNPVPHDAPTRDTVNTVIELALKAGGGAVTLLSSLLAAMLILYSGYVLYDTFNTQQQASSSAWDLLKFKPEIIENNSAPLSNPDLEAINQDYRAWLTVFDTSIDYPVVQGPNDLYYANHDVYGQPSLTGAIYLAALNSPDFSDSYNVIFGHHMDNGAMFGGLDNYLDVPYAVSHREGVLVTPGGIFDVDFLAVLTTDAYEDRIYQVGNRMGDVLDFLRSGGEGGVGVGTEVIWFDEEAASDAVRLIALSTCFDTTTSGRLVVIGRITRHVITTQVSVKKVFDDADNQDGIRPDSVTAVLSNGQEVVLNEANGWTATVTDLPKYDDHGEILYTWTERDIPGYTLVGNETEDGLTTLTNRHVPAETSRTVRKVWADDDNRDGLRPFSVTLRLSSGQTVELNEGNGWTATVEHLPMYADGQLIAYTWEEDPVEGYDARITPEGEVTTVTNTHAILTRSLTVRKVWRDAENQDALRPVNVTVSLYAGDELRATLTLSESNGWTATVDGLPVNEGGQPIAYRWAEAEVPGYEGAQVTEGDVTTFTNTHSPETTSVTVVKIWDDNSDQDRVRPDSLRVTLSNGRTVTLTPGNGWRFTVNNLPVYDHGERIVYTWTEEDIPGYTLVSTAVNGDTTVLTNRHTTSTTVATVVKVWDDDGNRDGVRPDSLTVTLSNGQTVILSEANHWTATIEGLPMLADGEPIRYTWTEEDVDGYTLATTVTGTITTLTNTHRPETTSLTVRKVWADDDNRDGLRPDSLTVTLSNGMTVTLNEANGWTATLDGLPVFENGQPIVYTWTEQSVPGYVLTVGTEGAVTVLTNTHAPETVDVTVRKVWEDADNQDGLRPESLTVTLSNGMTVTLSEANGWTATLTGLPACENGQPIDYVWTEADIPGYQLISQVAVGGTTTLTNRHVPAQLTFRVRKVWNDDDNRDQLRPDSLTVTLNADGNPVRTVILNRNNSWSAVLEGLPACEGGQPIRYTWSEQETAGYTLRVTSEDAWVVLTNTHEPETVSLTVRKVWEDDGNRDGLRPLTLTLTLMAGGGEAASVTLSAENNWTATVEGLPRYDRGAPIAYTWVEENIPGYTGTVTADGDVTTFTNRHEPQTTRRTIVKQWLDGGNQDGVRPERLEVTLTADGETVFTGFLSEDNSWTLTVEDLPVNRNGAPIAYAWSESLPEGYIRTNTTVNATVTTLTNTHVPQKMPLTVAKVWNDADNRDDARPDSLTVRLLADGEETARVTLDADNGWSATVRDLPVYRDGTAIVYTWSEPDIPGYTLTSTDVSGTITTLTNTYAPDTVERTVRKVWNDNGRPARPQSLTMVLTGGGQAWTVTLNEQNGWTATVTGLPRLDADGREIVYTWTEPSVNGYTQQGREVNGTVTTFTNNRNPRTNPRSYTLTVYYRFLNGTPAAPTVRENHNAGDPYDVVSPEIPGYTATILRVTGIMPPRDLEYLVIYIPLENVIIIDDDDRPLGLGPVQINIGDCLE